MDNRQPGSTPEAAKRQPARNRLLDIQHSFQISAPARAGVGDLFFVAVFGVAIAITTVEAIRRIREYYR